MGPSLLFNLISAVVIFAAAGVPLYLITRLRGAVRRLALIFAAFIIVHGFYHVAVILGFQFIGEGFLEPLSVLILLSFGLSYLRLAKSSIHARRSTA